MLNHPETSNYGLDCDFTLWAEFNKELLIRRWITSSREYGFTYPLRDNLEVACGCAEERASAEVALNELVEAGFLSPITYLKTI